MKFLVFSLLLLAFAAFAHAADDFDLSESPELHLVTPDEMAALGFADAARVRFCIASQCNSFCRSLGYRIGRCIINAYCVCSRKVF